MNLNKLGLCEKMWNFVVARLFMQVGAGMSFM